MELKFSTGSTIEIDSDDDYIDSDETDDSSTISEQEKYESEVF